MRRAIGFEEGPELGLPGHGTFVLGAFVTFVLVAVVVVRRAQLALEQPVDLRVVVGARDARRANGREEGREEVTHWKKGQNNLF